MVLSGIKILDFGRFIAAPWCSALLADMGADVIRVERREGGEDRWVQPVTPDGEGATFLQCNRNKRSVTLDTSKPRGREIAATLIASSDIVIANMPESAMRANGLDYESVRAINPDVILASATAFGNGGPYSERVGFDGIGQVMSGGVYRSGTPEQPMRCAVPWVDFGTALTLALGTMMALYHRQATGEGQWVQSALLPTALMMTNPWLIEQDLIATDRGRLGNKGQAVAPCDLFQAKDGWMLVQISGQPMFKRWCRMVGEEGWLTDPCFATDDLRAVNEAPLNGRMAEWCAARTIAEASEALNAARLSWAPMMSPQDALDDPHVNAMGFLHDMEYPGLQKPARIIGTPFDLSRTPGTVRRRAPQLGEHTREVLGEAGLAAAEIDALYAELIV